MQDISLNKTEIEARVKGFQQKLQDRNLKGVLLSAESNVQYFTGYCSHAPWSTFTRPSYLFIPQVGTPLLFVQTFVAPEAKIVTFCCDVRGFDSLLGATSKELQEIMYALDMKDGNIGFELGFEQRIGFEVRTFLELKELCKSENFIDASDVIWEQRIIKSDYEIKCLRRACEATNYAHDEIIKYIKEGMSEREVSRIIQKLMLDGGAEYPGFVIFTSGAGNYDRISKASTDRVLQKGDFIWLDLGARYNGYWSDFCRASILGDVKPEFQDLQSLIHEVTMNAASFLKNGVSVKDIAKECANGLIKNGYEATFDCGRMGHGMGLMSTEPPSVTIYDDTILKESMIINLEPGVVNENGVFCIEENFVITKDGFETLSGSDRKIRSIK